jgi:hypothetical protein
MLKPLAFIAMLKTLLHFQYIHATTFVTTTVYSYFEKRLFSSAHAQLPSDPEASLVFSPLLQVTSRFAFFEDTY